MPAPIPAADDFLAVLRTIPRGQQTLLVGVDGRGGSGKSTFARELEQSASELTVVEFDDFYLPLKERQARVARGDTEVGGNFDWRRLKGQVLAPLSRDQAPAYQRYDWPTDELAEWHLKKSAISRPNIRSSASISSSTGRPKRAIHRSPAAANPLVYGEAGLR